MRDESGRTSQVAQDMLTSILQTFVSAKSLQNISAVFWVHFHLAQLWSSMARNEPASTMEILQEISDSDNSVHAKYHLGNYCSLWCYGCAGLCSESVSTQEFSAACYLLRSVHIIALRRAVVHHHDPSRNCWYWKYKNLASARKCLRASTALYRFLMTQHMLAAMSLLVTDDTGAAGTRSEPSDSERQTRHTCANANVKTLLKEWTLPVVTMAWPHLVHQVKVLRAKATKPPVPSEDSLQLRWSRKLDAPCSTNMQSTGSCSPARR